MTKNYHKNVARHRLDKAHLSLDTARQLYSLGKYGDAVSKSYYCILTAMRALLSLRHQDSHRHEGVITLFHKLYVQTKLFPKDFNRIIKEMKDLHEEADYGDFVEISEEEAADKIHRAEDFLKKTEEVFVKILTGSHEN